MLKLANQGFQKRTEFAEGEMEKLRQDHSKMKESYLNMQVGDESLKQELEKILLENETHKESISILNREKIDLANKLQLKSAEIHQLNANLEVLNTENSESKQNLANLNQRVDSVEAENAQLKNNVQFYEQELETQRERIIQELNYSELNKSHENLQKDQEDLLENFEQLKNAHDHLIQQYEGLKNEKQQFE